MKNNIGIGRKILSTLGIVSCGFIFVCLISLYIGYIETSVLVMTVFQFVLFVIYTSGSISIFSKKYSRFLNKEMIKHKAMTVSEIILLAIGNINTFFAAFVLWDNASSDSQNVLLILLIVSTLLILSNCISMVILRVRFIEMKKKKLTSDTYDAYEDNLKENPNKSPNDNIVYLNKELYNNNNSK